MPTKMYIFGESSLWSSHGRHHGVFDLEHDLNNFLQDRGEVIWDGDEHRGLQWNVDLLLHCDAEDIDGWIERLTVFLREWGIPDRTLSFTVIREGTSSRWEHRQVKVGGS